MYKHGHYKEVKVMHLAEYLAERLVEEEKNEDKS
jgi:glycolate oxidase iron-sulfur subunit